MVTEMSFKSLVNTFLSREKKFLRHLLAGKFLRTWNFIHSTTGKVAFRSRAH